MMNAINIIGFLLTIAALIVTFAQIRKTRVAAEAAERAATSAQETIKKNVALADITVCIKVIEEIRVFLRTESFESATLRTTDLLSQLTQLRHLQDIAQENAPVNFRNSLAQLSIMKGVLEDKMRDDNCAVDTRRCNKQLSEISTQLNDWLGRKKFSISKGA